MVEVIKSFENKAPMLLEALGAQSAMAFIIDFRAKLVVAQRPITDSACAYVIPADLNPLEITPEMATGSIELPRRDNAGVLRVVVRSGDRACVGRNLPENTKEMSARLYGDALLVTIESVDSTGEIPTQKSLVGVFGNVKDAQTIIAKTVGLVLLSDDDRARAVRNSQDPSSPVFR